MVYFNLPIEKLLKISMNSMTNIHMQKHYKDKDSFISYITSLNKINETDVIADMSTIFQGIFIVVNKFGLDFLNDCLVILNDMKDNILDEIQCSYDLLIDLLLEDPLFSMSVINAQERSGIQYLIDLNFFNEKEKKIINEILYQYDSVLFKNFLYEIQDDEYESRKNNLVSINHWWWSKKSILGKCKLVY